MSIYYLIDHVSKELVPYFGIAYYRADQKLVNTRMVANKLQKVLGDATQANITKPGTTYITQAPISELDEENDPKNICSAPRPHSFLAVVKEFKGKSDQPELVVIANVKNLCHFGDRMANRIAGSNPTVVPTPRPSPTPEAGTKSKPPM